VGIDVSHSSDLTHSCTAHPRTTVISSIESSLNLYFPAPFSNVLKALSFLQLDILHLPVGCIARFDFYQKILFSTIAPTVAVCAVGLLYLLRTRFTTTDSGRAKVFAVHVKLALFVTFMMYPTTSATIFEMLRKCDDFSFSPSFMKVDRQLQCYTSKYNLFVAYAYVMLLLITIGVPATYAFLLHRNRSRCNPSCKDETTKQRVRAKDSEIVHISFLFKGACTILCPGNHSILITFPSISANNSLPNVVVNHSPASHVVT
jgi:hypothetical protein